MRHYAINESISSILDHCSQSTLTLSIPAILSGIFKIKLLLQLFGFIVPACLSEISCLREGPIPKVIDLK